MESWEVVTTNLRIIDANLNRLKEGLRVIEDIARYILDDKKLTIQIKTIRHKATYKNTKLLLQNRNTDTDVLKTHSTSSEESRENILSIILANSKRVQESARVLEEVLKMENVELSSTFKEIRYFAYKVEKDLFLRFDDK